MEDAIRTHHEDGPAPGRPTPRREPEPEARRGRAPAAPGSRVCLRGRVHAAEERGDLAFGPVGVPLRLDQRLQGRVDPSDVLQEAFLEATRRRPEYLRQPGMPFFLWLRLLTGQRLIDLHRQHLGAKMRDAGLEVSLYRGDCPRASSASLAELLLGRLTTASRAAIRAETQLRVQEALNAMDAIDREVRRRHAIARIFP